MKTIKFYFSFFLFASCLSVSSQVQINKQIQLTGSGTDARITGIQSVTGNMDGVSVDALQKGNLVYSLASGSGNNFTLSISPAITAYQAGMVFNFISNQTVTGVSTLTVNSLSTITIKKNINQDLAGCEIQNGQAVTVLYDGTNFQMLSAIYPGVSSSNVIAFAGTGIAYTYFTASWTSVSGATAYYIDVATDPAFSSILGSFNNLNVGNVASFMVTGLMDNTVYYYRVRAGSSCGTSANSNIVSVLTLFPCGSTFGVTHTIGNVAPATKGVNYGTVSTSVSGATKCWITQNLGADNQASSATDATDAAAGWYWQFNRKQGYLNTGGTVTPAWTISSINENSDWVPSSDPCTLLLGTGWRMPTSTEWGIAYVSQSWNNSANTYASVLKIHGAGLLDVSNGALLGRGTNGGYESSTQVNNTNEFDLGFDGFGCSVHNDSKAYGFTMRCLRDN